MILSDSLIRYEIIIGNLVVDPAPPDSAFQPASLELRLAEAMTLQPGEFRLGHTLEKIGIPDHLVGQVNGKSSLGRLGLLVHATAGFVDPGFAGQLTLELKNLTPSQLEVDRAAEGSRHLEPGKPIQLEKHQPVCQLVLFGVLGTVLRPYGHPELGSHYQGQSGTTPSWLEERREAEDRE